MQSVTASENPQLLDVFRDIQRGTSLFGSAVSAVGICKQEVNRTLNVASDIVMVNFLQAEILACLQNLPDDTNIDQLINQREMG